MTDFLLELRCEEIPARMQAGARGALEKLFREQMAAAGVALGGITVWSTPRRLALIARDLPLATEAVREEAKGPRTSAPAQALEGFLRKTGLTQDQLTERDGVWFAVTEKPGRATAQVLAEAIPQICRAFPWPKSMRWGASSISTESLRWVRPLSGIVAIFGEELVACEVGGVVSGYATRGHRFHHPDPITIGSAHDYAGKLRACHVIVDHAEREALIRDRAKAAAEAEGLVLVEDEGLVVENAGLTEWPVPLLGRFEEAFLEVPPEVIQLTARTNQKYFVCEFPSRPREGQGEGLLAASETNPPPTPPASGRGALANAFVCTANIDAIDGGVGVVAGNRKVLAARLSDARFFWEQDRRKTLAQHAEGLARITFHEKLGTVADKVERVAKLARWLVEEGIVRSSPSQSDGEGDHPQDGGGVTSSSVTPPSAADASATSPLLRNGEDLDRARLADMAEQAARLCKADLVTEMVGEFPELQGLMGGYYARAEGLADQIADAIRDHYKPVGQGDEVPTAPVTVAVSLADKLDTLAGFFAAGMLPTGSKDPFALRRAALSVISIIQSNALRVQLSWPLAASLALLVGRLTGLADRSAFEIGVEQLSGAGVAFSEEAVDKLRQIALQNAQDQSSVLYDQVIEPAIGSLLAFFADRLKVQQREAGVRHDLIDAVFALGGEDDLVRLLARVHALQAFVGTEDGVNLLAGYKRAANILKKEGYQAPATLVTPAQAGVHLPGVEPDEAPELDSSLRGNDEDRKNAPGTIPRTGDEDPYAMVDDPDIGPILAAKMREREDAAEAEDLAAQQPVSVARVDPAEAAAPLPSYALEPAEQALVEALDAAVPQASAGIAAEDFAGAMAALASLRAPIDAFFNDVTVNDGDPVKREARLALLDRFRAAVHNVADFSKIEG